MPLSTIAIYDHAKYICPRISSPYLHCKLSHSSAVDAGTLFANSPIVRPRAGICSCWW
ncbi:hypothetical protein LINPERHAP1_LOCUS17827 [Linum perenne]